MRTDLHIDVNTRHALASRIAGSRSESTKLDSKPDWPKLDEVALYGLAGDIVRALEPHTEADKTALLVQSLVAFGLHVGRGPHIRVEGDEHHANLFALIIGSTSKGRKGTSWGRVREVFENLSDWPIAVSGLSSGEGLKFNVRDGDDKDPGVADKRLLVIESEFAQVLRSISRQGNTLSATVRAAWDSGNLRTLTKNDPVIATGAHIAIIGHVTVDELRSELTATDRGNGFANRFLFVCVKRSKVLPFGGGSVPKNVLEDLRGRLGASVDAARKHGGAVSMDGAARNMWECVYPVMSEGHAGMLGAVTNRAEAQTLRLALLYASMDESSVIGKAHLEAAIALWEYCEASARFIFGSALGDSVADEIDRALRAARDAGMTRTEIRDLFARNKSAERIDGALATLTERQRAYRKAEATDGRPAERWYSYDINDRNGNTQPSVVMSSMS